MMKKLLLLFFTILSLFIFVDEAKSQIKISSVLFDNSDTEIFLLTDTLQNEEETQIKIEAVKLDNNRIYFNINDAVLSASGQIWELQNSNIAKVQVAQFKTNPNIVRLVLHCNENIAPEHIKVTKTGGIIVFKYNKQNIGGSYYSNSYRESTPVNHDYSEKLTLATVTEKKIEVPQEQTPAKNFLDKEIAQIEQSVGIQKKEPEIKKIYTNHKLNLRTRFFLNRIDIKAGNILVYGTGKIEIKKPLFLTTPSRIVYDFPGTIINNKIKGHEYTLSENETVKIAQFDSSTARLVITTPTPEKYRTIYSSNMQSALISNDDRIHGVTLFNSLAKINKMKMTTTDDNTDILTMQFESPLIHSIKNNGNNIEIILYNTEGITPQMLSEVFNVSRISSIKANRFSQNGYRIVIPTHETTKVDEIASADGKNFKIVIKTPIEVINTINAIKTKITQSVIEPVVKQTGYPAKRNLTVVLDPGHGGTDVGATREGVYEKDINLKVANKVADILLSKGIKVEMTHSSDQTQSLQARVDFAESKKAALFVSIHTNASSKPEIHGIETHYYHEYSKDLAGAVQKHLSQNTDAHNRGILQSKFYVINHTTMPAILVEIGFISNNNERKALLTERRQNQTANAIVEGIMDILNKK